MSDLYAVVSSLTSGHDYHQKLITDRGWDVGHRVKVDKIDMYMYDRNTKVYLEGEGQTAFNSANFKFERADGTPHDIFEDPVYNPRKRIHDKDQLKNYKGTISDAYHYGLGMIVGNVSGHPWFNDGWIRTSDVLSVKDNGDGTHDVETRNSLYKVIFKEGESVHFKQAEPE